jgi:hypothetical protein
VQNILAQLRHTQIRLGKCLIKKVSADRAKSILILGVGAAAAADARAIRVLMSLINGMGPRLQCHVTVEVADADAEALVHMIGAAKVETVVAHEVLGRLLIQCARQPGLVRVWDALLGFEGSEFYAMRWPSLAGKTFGEALYLFPSAVPIGVRRAGHAPLSGRRASRSVDSLPLEDLHLLLNPPDTLRLEAGDEVVLLAEDDGNLKPTQYFVAPFDHPAAATTAFHQPPSSTHGSRTPEKVLFLGWRRDMDSLLGALNSWVPPGSELLVVCKLSSAERAARLAAEEFSAGSLPNLTVTHAVGDPTSRRHLQKLPWATFSWCLVLADEDAEADTLAADTASLSTLLVVRDLQAAAAARASGATAPVASTRVPCPVLAELLDAGTKSLVSAAVADSVLGSGVVSMYLAMVSEDRKINGVLK